MTLFILSSLIGICQENDNPIIPKPYFSKALDAVFTIDNNTVININDDVHELKPVAIQLSDDIFISKGIRLPVVNRAIKGQKSIDLLLGEKTAYVDNNEKYELQVSETDVFVTSQSTTGLFYGVQSLLQLLRNSPNNVINGIKIIDKPLFRWRGLMLDVARYYYPPEFIKKLLDQMAVYKLNKFHWHLTDDQGWRIEIKKYPELTKKGAWRKQSQFAIGLDNNWINKNPHGGYYTQDEIKDIVAYAKSKQIDIIPEIEMPGHAMAALATYPDLSCQKKSFEVPGTWGVKSEVFCAGDEKVFLFLENVLSEVIDLFPSEIIHIGGDECPKERWKECSKCQLRIKQQNLKNEHELQSYFIKRVEKFLNSKGKSIIGWDEILEGGLAPNAMVMSWRGTKGGIEAIKQGHQVVMSPNTFFYLDYYQGLPELEPPYGRIREKAFTIENVYSYTPTIDNLSADEVNLIAGIQANVWTELLHTQKSVEYMIFPRIAAVSEVAWTQPNLKNWKDFSRRLEYEFVNYEKLGINYAKSIYDVWYTATIDSTSSKARISLEAYNYKPEIRYTLDGTEPTIYSKLYSHPFLINLPLTLKAATFREGKRIGKVNSRSFVIFE